MHHHFSQQPLSALLESDQCLEGTAWKSLFFTRLRDTLTKAIDREKGGLQIELPLPEDVEIALSKHEFFQDLLRNDQSLYIFAKRCVNNVRREREAILAGVHFTHFLRDELGMNRNNEDQQNLIFEPRKNTFGGLLYALLNPENVVALVQDIRAALRMKSLSELETILEKVGTRKIVQGTGRETAFEAISGRLAATTTLSEKEKQELSSGKGTMSNGKDDQIEKETRRLDLVHRNLLREESNSALRREICDLIVATLRSLFTTASPFSQLCQYNSVGYLSSILEPSPRINHLAALKDPDAYLERAIEVPDICCAFQTYEDAGRLINLADWFNAFHSSIQKRDGEKINARKRKRLDADTQSEPEAYERDLDVWKKRDMVRLRFALAVHEMGKMGFLKRTRRKLEHVLKLVYDLPLRNS